MNAEQVVILIVVNLGVYQPNDLIVETVLFHVDLRLAGHLDAEAQILAQEFLPIVGSRRRCCRH
jgi:hypothetical protein